MKPQTPMTKADTALFIPVPKPNPNPSRTKTDTMKIPSPLLARLLAAAFVSLLAVPAFAASDTWNGGGAPSFNWSTSANWNNAPVANDLLFFDLTTGLVNTNDLPANTFFNGLTFNSTAGAFTLNGNAVNLNGGITNASASLQTVNLNLALQGNETVKATGGLTLGGAVSGAFSLTNVGSGTLTLGGSNTYSGGTILNAGTVQLGNTNGLGTGNVIIASGATLDLNGQTITNAISNIASGGILANSSASSATVSTAIGSATASQLGNFIVNAGGNITLSDVFGVQNGASIAKTGAGTLTLGGTNQNSEPAGSNPLQLSVTNGLVVLAKTGIVTAADGANIVGGTVQMDPAHQTAPANGWAGQLNGGANLLGGTFDLKGVSGINNRMQHISGTSGLITNSSATAAVLTLEERGGGPYANAEVIGGNLSLSLQNSSGGYTLSLSGNNTYSGNTTNAVGTLALNSSTAIGTGTLVLNGGSIDNSSGAPITLANNNPQVWSSSFTFAGTTNLNLGTGAVTASGITVTANTNTLTVGGVVSGGANTLTMAGTGTLQLSGNNTWGNANLTAGTLLFGGTATTATESLGNVTVGNNGGTVGSLMLFSNTTVNITGANNTAVGGATQTNNTLWIKNSTWNGNGQRLQTGAGVGDALIIDGSIATNFTSLIGGNAGSAFNSAIIVTNGGILYVSGSSFNELGRNTGANTNSIIITGSGSALLYSGTVGFSIGGTSGTTSNNVMQVNNGGLWNHGGGTMRLNMGNYGSGIVINGGVLTNVYSMIVGNGSLNNFVNVTGGGQFYFSANSGDFRESGRGGSGSNVVSINGTNSLWNSAGATFTVGGSNPYSGNNTFAVSSGGVFTNGSINLSGVAGNALVVSNGTAYISALTVNGGANVYLNGGTADALYVDNFSGGSSSSYITGTVSSASSLIGGYLNSSSSITPIVAGNINLIKVGSGTLTLANAANSYGGGTTIKAGTVSVGSATGLGTNTVTVGDAATGAAATLQVTAAVTVTNNITVAAGAGARTLLSGSSATYSGNVALNTNLLVSQTGGSPAFSGTFTGSGSLTVSNTGGGNVTLSGPSSPGWTGGCAIVAGLNFVGGTSQLNSNTVLSIASGATLNNENNNITAAGVNDIAGATGGTLNGGYGTPTLTVKGAGNYAFSGTYSGAGGLNVSLASGGSQTLSGTNAYTGTTTVNSGKLVLYSYSLQSGAVSVSDGATLDVTVAGTSQITNSTLTVGSTTGATIEFVNLNSTTIAPVVTPTLTANGTATINLITPTLAVGTYPLITFTTGGGTGNFVIGTAPRGSVINLVTNGSGPYTLALNVTTIGGASTDIWSGAQNTNWDINTSTNWTISAAPNTYFDGDYVQFTDASSVTNVTLSATVLPAGTTVNSSQNYTLISSGVPHIGGSGGLAKSGTGTLTLTGLANTYTGTNTITGGTVVISADNNLGSSANPVVIDGGTLSVSSGLTLNASRSLLLGAGTVNVASGQTVNFAGVVTSNSPSAGALTKTGNGILNLTGTNTYTGITTVSAGKLALTTAQQGGGALTVSDTAAVRVSTAGGAQFPVSTLTFGTSGATTVEFQGISGTNAAITATALVANGTITVNLIGGAVALGEIPLISYTSKSGSGTFAVGTLPPNITAVITNDTVNKVVALNVTAIGQLTWSGATSSAWDIATTTNWLFGATPSIYSDNSPLLFNNSGFNTVSVTVPVSPGSITVSNTTADNYTFSAANGTARINGTNSLVKLGNGTLTLGVTQTAPYLTNTYSGGTVIGGGTVIIPAHSTAVPNLYELGTGPVTVTNGAILQLNGVGGGSTVNPQYLTNSISLNGGTIFGNDGGQHLTGSISFGAGTSSGLAEAQGNKYLFIDGALTGTGNLTIPGIGGDNGPVIITSAGNSYSGTITVNNGVLGIDDTGGTALQNATLNLIGYNAALNVCGVYWISNTTQTVTLGGLTGTSGLNLTELDAWNVSLTLGNNAPGALVYNGVLSDTSALSTVTKTGSNTQWLNGTNTYTGATFINQGTLGISTLHAGGGNFSIADGAVLAVTNGSSALSAQVGTLNAGTSAGADIAFYNLTNRTSLTNAPLTVQTLNANGTVLIDVISGGPFTIGQAYPLIRFTSGGGSGGFAVGVFTRAYTASLSTNNNGDGTSTLELNIAGAGAPDRWTGNQSGVWDINTSTNWFAGGVNTVYLDGDGVRFDDTSATQNVTVPATVTPNSVLVTNSTKNYSITGSAIAGSGGLAKYGTGTLTLTNIANTFGGGVIIGGGTVAVDADASLGSSANGIVLSNATLNALATFSSSRAVAVNAANISVGSGQALTLNGVVANNVGAGSLVKSGAGTLTLNGANTYTGSTTVSNGTLSVATAQQGGGAISVKDGAALTVVGNTVLSLPASSLTLGVSGASTLALSGIGSVPVVRATNLTLNGTVTVNIGGVAGTGQFPLIKYTGSIGGVGYGALSLGTLPLGMSASLSNNTANSSVDLKVTAIAPLTWTGINGSAWDIGVTTNWQFSSTPVVYANGEAVLFDDTASGYSVSLNGLLSPSGVTVNNSSTGYTVSVTNGGFGIAGGGSLTKLGSSSLTIGKMTNSYSGGTVVAGGTLELATATNIVRQQLGTGSVTVSNNALLQLDGLGGNSTVYPVYLPNAVTFDNGRLYGADGGQHLSGAITIAAGGLGMAEQSANKYLYLDGPVSGSGTVTIPGSGYLAGFGGFGPVQLTCATNPFNGTVTLNSGQLGIEDTNGTALANATVNLNGFNANPSVVITNTPVTWSNNLSGTLTFGALGGTVALNLNDARMPAISTLTLGNSSGAIYSGVLAGGFNLNKTGSGTQALVGANTYTGNTVISNGTLVISTLHAGGGGFTVNDGANLVVTNAGGASAAAIASLTVGNSGATTLGFEQVSNLTTPVVACSGSLTVNGTSTIAIIGTNGLAGGNQYPLISVVGSLGGGGSLSLSLPPTVVATLVTNAGSPTVIALNVTSVGFVPSTNAYLAWLVVSNSTGALAFYPSGFTTNNFGVYYATNAYGAGAVTVTVTNVDATATNTLFLGGNSQGLLTNGLASGPLTLAVGTTNVAVQVVSQDLTQTNTYTVALTQLGSPVSSVTYLTSLVLSNSAGAFFNTNNPATGVYAVTNTVANNPVTVTVTNFDSTATNTLFLGLTPLQLLTNGLASGVLNLPVGTTNLTVQTVSQSLTVTNNYTVNLTLQDTNALLSNLFITPGALSQAFSPGLKTYTATNTYPATNVTVTATSADGTAALALGFNTGGSYGIPLTNGVASVTNTMSLSSPANVLAVQVVSQDLSQTNIYTVNVLLQPSQSVPKLTNSVSGNNLVLSWPADHLGYRLLVQTNNLNKGVSGNTNDWGTVAGSQSLTATNLAIIKTGVTNQYYKLVYP